MTAIVDITGQRFGRWVVKSFGENRNSVLYWNCVCDCGTERLVRGGGLKAGIQRSCGCAVKERLRAYATSHGLAGHPAYKCWQQMKNRCQNPNYDGYDLYGGRGIKVCDDWQTFEGFWRDMEPEWFKGGSIERREVNGDYEPGNCTWATRKEQANNRRNNHFIATPLGRMTISEASEKYGISPITISSRIRYGWPEADLLKPVRKRRSE